MLDNTTAEYNMCSTVNKTVEQGKPDTLKLCSPAGQTILILYTHTVCSVGSTLVGFGLRAFSNLVV